MVDYSWSVDTLIFDLTGLLPPDQVMVQCIWGSSPHDVWATAVSDVVFGELWHFDGRSWTALGNWPFSGIDSGGSYINDIYAVTGFDSVNSYFFGNHGYDSNGVANVLRWDGTNWNSLPWLNNTPPHTGIRWGVKQNNDRLWSVSTSGTVIRYEGGVLASEPLLTGISLGILQVAALDNGEVYVNAHKDSISNGTLQGTITRLFMRDLSGTWTLVEDKFIPGGYEDGNGLGLGVMSLHNRLFTTNRGLWEWIGTSWVNRVTLPNFGGQCFVSDQDMWVYYDQTLVHFDGKGWNSFTPNVLIPFQGYFLFGQGWSDGQEVFISLTRDGRQSFVLHGKKL
jgi:hypothetical protein